jgi:hypothetical protein
MPLQPGLTRVFSGLAVRDPVGLALDSRGRCISHLASRLHPYQVPNSIFNLIDEDGLRDEIICKIRLNNILLHLNF